MIKKEFKKEFKKEPKKEFKKYPDKNLDKKVKKDIDIKEPRLNRLEKEKKRENKQDSEFILKQKSGDFIVEEILPFKLSGKGDAFYVYFEKRNINTMDVLDYLRKTLGVSRMALGIAGLKDRTAIARQRISIYRSQLKKIGGEKEFVEALSTVTKVIDTGWNEFPLNMTIHIKNRFFLKVRNDKSISQLEKEKIKKKALNIFEKGFPNVFGDQRFGINNRNRIMGKQIIDCKLKLKSNFETLFKLQAYVSYMFNEYVVSRDKKGLKTLDGDILALDNAKYNNKYGLYCAATNTVKIFEKIKDSKNFFTYPEKFDKEVPYDPATMAVTGPVVGFDTLLAPASSEVGIKEQSFLAARSLNEKRLEIYKDLKIFGLRRTLREFPTDCDINFDRNDILFKFTLNSGTYASVLIDKIVEIIGVK